MSPDATPNDVPRPGFQIADVDTSDSDMEQTIQVLPLFDGYIFSVSSLTGLDINDGEYTTITSYIISNTTGEVVSVDYFFS